METFEQHDFSLCVCNTVCAPPFFFLNCLCMILGNGFWASWVSIKSGYLRVEQKHNFIQYFQHACYNLPNSGELAGLEGLRCPVDFGTPTDDAFSRVVKNCDRHRVHFVLWHNPRKRNLLCCQTLWTPFIRPPPVYVDICWPPLSTECPVALLHNIRNLWLSLFFFFFPPLILDISPLVALCCTAQVCVCAFYHVALKV